MDNKFSSLVNSINLNSANEQYISCTYILANQKKMKFSKKSDIIFTYLGINIHNKTGIFRIKSAFLRVK